MGSVWNLGSARPLYRERKGPFSMKTPSSQQGKKRVYTTTVAPLLSRSVARPRGHRAKKAMVYTIFLGKPGQRVYTIGPERRAYTIEPQTLKKKKGRVSTVVVYTFFFPESALPNCPLKRTIPQRLRKNLAHYRIGKRPHRAKIHPK